MAPNPKRGPKRTTNAPKAKPAGAPASAARKSVADTTAKDAIKPKGDDGSLDVNSMPKKSRELYESVVGILDGLEMDSDVKDSLKGMAAYIAKYLPNLFGGFSPQAFFEDIDDKDNDLKDEKLKPEDEEKLKNAWNIKEPEITPEFIENLQKFSNEKAATIYACAYLGDIKADDPKVLAAALKHSVMGSGPRYRQVQSKAQLKSPVKKGTVVFLSFKPFSGEVTPCVATGNDDVFKLLAPDPKDKSENPKKAERTLTLSKLPGGLNFKGALIPRHVTDVRPFTDSTFKGDAEIDIEDDTPVGLVLAAPVKADVYAEKVGRKIDTIKNREVRYHAHEFIVALDALDKWSELMEEARLGMEKVHGLNPEVAKRLLPKFLEAARSYKKHLDLLKVEHEKSLKMANAKLATLKQNHLDLLKVAYEKLLKAAYPTLEALQKDHPDLTVSGSDKVALDAIKNEMKPLEAVSNGLVKMGPRLDDNHVLSMRVTIELLGETLETLSVNKPAGKKPSV